MGDAKEASPPLVRVAMGLLDCDDNEDCTANGPSPNPGAGPINAATAAPFLDPGLMMS